VDLEFPLPGRMVEQARQFTAGNREPVEARLASTVVLLRPAEDGYEVFAIRRVATMAFAAGMYAFPGGAVDPRDFPDEGDQKADQKVGAKAGGNAGGNGGWAGPPLSAWAARLGLDEARARAVLCAAVREVFEESGVLLAGPDPASVVGDVSGDDWEAARVALIDRSLGFAELLADRGLVLRTDLLAPWSRWVTPEFEPRRYDTYFFVAVLPTGQRTRDVGGEAALTRWGRPGDLLDESLPMLPPTMSTLRLLGRHHTIAAVFEAAEARDAATPVQPRIEFGEDGNGTLIVPG
jgi:8-oxo-dGTP pyrophosphatase MutT (NUDIX family)